VRMFSFFTDSHAEQRMRAAESSGDRFPDPAHASPKPSSKGETLRVPRHPGLVPSLRNAVATGEQAKAADKPRYYGGPVPSLRDLGTTTEGPERS
jgi:hypothetical protein